MRFFSREVMAVVEELTFSYSRVPAAAPLVRLVAFARDGERLQIGLSLNIA